MKRFFAIILTICLVASALCVFAFAEDNDISDEAKGYEITTDFEKNPVGEGNINPELFDTWWHRTVLGSLVGTGSLKVILGSIVVIAAVCIGVAVYKKRSTHKNGYDSNSKKGQ